METTIIFKGEKYKRYPDSKRRQLRVYFYKSGKGFKALHREIWKSYNGEIPKGFTIHHKDGNPFNNNIKNLQLISISFHQSIHAKKKLLNPEFRKRNKQQLAIIRKEGLVALDKFKRSRDGKRMLKENAYKSFYLKEPKKFKCIECKKESTTEWKQGGMFCSKKCSARNRAREWRRKYPNYWKEHYAGKYSKK